MNGASGENCQDVARHLFAGEQIRYENGLLKCGSVHVTKDCFVDYATGMRGDAVALAVHKCGWSEVAAREWIEREFPSPKTSNGKSDLYPRA